MNDIFKKLKKIVQINKWKIKIFLRMSLCTVNTQHSSPKSGHETHDWVVLIQRGAKRECFTTLVLSVLATFCSKKAVFTNIEQPESQKSYHLILWY